MFYEVYGLGKGENMMEQDNVLDITVNPNYVKDWTFLDAVRELIQNGVDAQSKDNDNTFELKYNHKEKILTFQIKNLNSKEILYYLEEVVNQMMKKP